MQHLDLMFSWERATTLISFYEASICKMKSCMLWCITVLGTKRREQNRSNILKGKKIQLFKPRFNETSQKKEKKMKCLYSIRRKYVVINKKWNQEYCKVRIYLWFETLCVGLIPDMVMDITYHQNKPTCAPNSVRFFFFLIKKKAALPKPYWTYHNRNTSWTALFSLISLIRWNHFFII